MPRFSKKMLLTTLLLCSQATMHCALAVHAGQIDGSDAVNGVHPPSIRHANGLSVPRKINRLTIPSKVEGEFAENHVGDSSDVKANVLHLPKKIKPLMIPTKPFDEKDLQQVRNLEQVPLPSHLRRRTLDEDPMTTGGVTKEMSSLKFAARPKTMTGGKPPRPGLPKPQGPVVGWREMRMVKPSLPSSSTAKRQRLNVPRPLKELKITKADPRDIMREEVMQKRAVERDAATDAVTAPLTIMKTHLNTPKDMNIRPLDVRRSVHGFGASPKAVAVVQDPPVGKYPDTYFPKGSLKGAWNNHY